MWGFVAAGVTIFTKFLTFLRQIKLAIKAFAARSHYGPRNLVADYQLVTKSIIFEIIAQSNNFADDLMAKYQRRRLGSSAADRVKIRAADRTHFHFAQCASWFEFIRQCELTHFQRFSHLTEHSRSTFSS